MPHSHKHTGSDWMSCTLCRSHRQSMAIFGRAKERKVDWPKPKEYTQSPVQDPLVYTSIDDAFASVLQYMSTTTRQCKRYYRSCCKQSVKKDDCHHCNRFHTSQYTKAQHSNPLQTAEDVHLVVHPGTYAVTAGEWGTSQQQTHMVRVQPGQSINLDFVM